ncbi:MAG: hypothetical protein K5875_00735 [Saccharofermentans sp.]|nr:hypothetical protein [Saccharofermentans sp.]
MTLADKKKGVALACIIIVVLAFIKVMFWNFGDLDELWNYNMSRGIVMGMQPYRDFNMVQTPLFAFINAFALLISRTLTAYRISCSVLLSVLMLLVFRTIAARTNEYYALPVTLICLLLSGTVSYNTLFMIFALVIYLLLVRGNTSSRIFLTGISAACAALSRQTSGGILILTVLIILASPLGGGSSIRRRVKDVLMYLAGGAVPCVLFLIYLLAAGSFKSFWDYCFFGLFAFGSGNSLFMIEAVPCLAIALSGIICDLLMMKTDRIRSLLHLLLGISILLIAVPITDGIHTAYAGIWFLIPVIFYLEKRYGSQLKKSMSTASSALFAAVAVIMTVFGILGYGTVDGIPELKGILADRYLVSDLKELSDRNKLYESEGMDVKTLSYSSVLVSVIGSDYDPVFDMFLEGNTGLTEPMEYVEEVLNRQDTIILMPDDYSTEGWQNPEGVYELVTSHCEVIGSYGRFKWYKPV